MGKRRKENWEKKTKQGVKWGKRKKIGKEGKERKMGIK